jgi:hypothetical protein
MNAIRIRKTLDSEMLHLPELNALIGRAVEIIILEEEPPARRGTGDWDAAARAVAELKAYDYDALTDQDECDRRHASDHLP